MQLHSKEKFVLGQIKKRLQFENKLPLNFFLENSTLIFMWACAINKVSKLKTFDLTININWAKMAAILKILMYTFWQNISQDYPHI